MHHKSANHLTLKTLHGSVRRARSTGGTFDDESVLHSRAHVDALPFDALLPFDTLHTLTFDVPRSTRAPVRHTR